MNSVNHQIIFDKRPKERPTEEVFSFSQSPIPAPEEQQFLIRNHYIAMDPALVSRMRDEPNYTESVNPGEVMHAYCVGEVVASNWEGAPVGQMRFGRFDMQEYFLGSADKAGMLIDTDLAPASWYLGVLGSTGATAYLSFKDICDPAAGETVVISSAGSSVGTVVAQLAREAACRVVGIVSTEDKAAKVRDQWGYDAVVSYRDKSVEQLAADLNAVCPNGIDVYYDNTSGDISEALLELYNVGARIAVIGRMALSHLSDTRLDIGRRDNNVILSRRIRKQGFVILDHFGRMREAALALAELIKDGKLQVQEDVLDGIERAPEAFFRMLRGENKGKQLVRLVRQ